VGGTEDAPIEDGEKILSHVHNQFINSEKYIFLQEQCNYEIGTINSYTTQLVAGVIHNVEYSILSKSCGANTCKTKVLEQAWLDVMDVMVFECDFTDIPVKPRPSVEDEETQVVYFLAGMVAILFIVGCFCRRKVVRIQAKQKMPYHGVRWNGYMSS